MGYASLSRAPGRRIEARLRGRRAADEDLCRVLHLVGLPRREAEFVTSKLSHPSGADRWRYLRASWTVIFLRRVPLRTGRARLLLTSGKISGAKNDEGYVSLARAPGRRVEARLKGRRVSGEYLHRLLRLVGVPGDEADLLASKLRHPSGRAQRQM